MLRAIGLVIPILAFVSCVTTPTSTYSGPPPTPRIYDASYDATWNALIRALSSRGIIIQSSDKASGLIQFTLAEQSPYMGVERTIDQFAFRPTRLLAVWRAVTIFASVHVFKEGEGQTKVMVTPVIRGENNLLGWEELRSRGTLENNIFSWIESGIGR